MKINNNEKKAIIFGLTNGRYLAEKISKKLNVPLGKMIISRFADGEIFTKSEVSVRGKDIYIIQSTSNPVNDNIMELLIAIDSLRRASAKSINVIMPYYGYARQDRKTSGREPITARLVADLLSAVKVDKITLVDVHSEQIQGYFDFPVDSLRAFWVIASKMNIRKSDEKLVVVSPDYGGVKRARRLGEQLNAGLAIVDKRRTAHNVSKSNVVLGDVKDANCVLVDDIIDTGGTIIDAAKLLKEHKAKKVSIIVTHGLFNKNAPEKLNTAIDKKYIDEIWISNSVSEKFDKYNIKKMHVVDLSDFLADIIKAYINSEPVSGKYEYWIEKTKKNWNIK